MPNLFHWNEKRTPSKEGKNNIAQSDVITAKKKILTLPLYQSKKTRMITKVNSQEWDQLK